MSNDNNDDYLVQSLFLLVITVICLAISWWSMATGYETFMGSYILSAGLATVFVLMLAALNYTLRRGLLKGISKGKITGLLIIYFLVVLLSFSGMFNKFYSQFMQNDLVKEEISQKIDYLEALRVNSMKVLTNTQADDIRRSVAELKGKLEREIKSQTELGIGKNAKAILREIQDLLGKTTPFVTPPTPTLSPTELKIVIERMHLEIDSEMKQSAVLSNLNSPEKFALSQTLPVAIKDTKDDLAAARDKIGSKSNEADRAAGIEAIQKAVDVYKRTASAVESTLAQGANYKYEKEIKVVNDRIGEIPHTYASARAHLHLPVVWIAALIALGLDLIVPIFVFALTPRSGVTGSGSFKRTARGASGLKAEH